MMRITRTLASSLATMLVAATIAPAANASPLGKLLHLHPRAARTEDSRITVRVYNQADLFRDVKVDGHTYTLMPHHGLAITAPVGTPVYAASIGFAHHAGELLFTVTPETKNATIYIN